MSEKDFLNRAG